MSRHVVFGTGQIGRHVIEHLVEPGHDVIAVNRSGNGTFPGAEVIGGDVTDPAFAKEVTRNADVVYFCLNAPSYHRWPEEFPPLQDSVLGAADRRRRPSRRTREPLRVRANRRSADDRAHPGAA